MTNYHKEKELKRILYNNQGQYESFPKKYRMYLVSCIKTAKEQESFSEKLNTKIGTSIEESISYINNQFILVYLQQNKYILLIDEDNPCAYSNLVEMKRIANRVEEINNIHILFIGYEELVEARQFNKIYDQLMKESEFKRKTGKTIQQYLTSVRMEKAIELLTNPQLKIKQVAEKVGYSNLSYFGMLFMREYSMTPRQYRLRLIHINGEDQ